MTKEPATVTDPACAQDTISDAWLAIDMGLTQKAAILRFRGHWDIDCVPSKVQHECKVEQMLGPSEGLLCSCVQHPESISAGPVAGNTSLAQLALSGGTGVDR